MIDFSAFSFMDIAPFILIGFAAQLVDGALGMAFGVISSTLLISGAGIAPPLAPAAASATVHTVECFTTAASGASHVIHRNVDWKLFAKLLIPGIIGGVTGAYLLSNISAEAARPFILAYLVAIGVYLIWRGMGHPPKPREPKVVAPLGLVGGFLDATGGGGWGPVVTSNLLIQGVEPRKVIGTVNTVEFFLTTTVSITFLIALGAEAFGVATIGLLIGGLLAAPLGGWAAKRVAPRGLMIMVGVVLTLTSGYGVWRALA